MKLVEIEYRGPVVGLVSHSVVFPAQSQVQREIGSNFPFVLEVGHVKCAAQPMAAPRRGEGDCKGGRCRNQCPLPLSSKVRMLSAVCP